jgi:hypothetical protein
MDLKKTVSNKTYQPVPAMFPNTLLPVEIALRFYQLFLH